MEKVRIGMTDSTFFYLSRGWGYPAQIVDNKGGYKVQYLDDDGELIPDEIEENVVVTRIRKPKKKKRVSVGQKEAEEEAPDSDE